MAIVDFKELLDYGNLEEERTDGPMLASLLAASERFIQRYARRTFAPEPALAAGGADTNPAVAKTFGVARGRNLIRIPDLRAASSVTLDGSAIDAVTGYYPLDPWEPAQSFFLYEPYGTSATSWSNPNGPGVVTITGRWGWNPVPEDITYAMKALTIRLYKERNANWADAVALPDGSILQYFRSLPATVQAAVSQYRPINIGIAETRSAP